MKNQIKFGVSTNKVGALTVYNFRIRTVQRSYLNACLICMWMTLRDNYKYEDSKPFMAHTLTRSKKYVIHDFSSISKSIFWTILYPQVKRSMLTAEVLKLRDKYKSLHVDIQVHDLNDEEAILVDDSCEL